ncbi:MAG TPA: hypothetical protein VKB75_11090 [Jatrophihabitans sp.]|nr:hypothetical protein [Jatrophihabitans sp.]
MHAFGHGLSYTTFEHSDLDVEGGDPATFTVTNTGHRNGADVPQLYLTDAPGQMSTLPTGPEHSPGSRHAAEMADTGRSPPSGHRRISKIVAGLGQLARAVADVDPAEIESTARRLGESRRYLAPVGWAAGAFVLVVRGVKLLVLNWRLTLVQFVPAGWVWLVMWDLKQHALRGDAFRQISTENVVLVGALAIAASIASFGCNTAFAFAISDPPPRIAPAARQAKTRLPWVVCAGIAMGVGLTAAAVAIPRLGSTWLYLVAIGAVYAVMLISFVAFPARIIGTKKRKLSARETAGRWAAGGALSAVAMTPGYVLDRLGLILLGVPGLKVIGFVLLSVGAALYAAGMTSVRAVKLSMKLDAPG